MQKKERGAEKGVRRTPLFHNGGLCCLCISPVYAGFFGGSVPCEKRSTSVEKVPHPRYGYFPRYGKESAILVEYFYGNGSPLFLRQCQMTSTPQNLIKNIIFMPQFLPGDVKMAPGNVKMAPGDVKL